MKNPLPDIILINELISPTGSKIVEFFNNAPNAQKAFEGSKLSPNVARSLLLHIMITSPSARSRYIVYGLWERE